MLTAAQDRALQLTIEEGPAGFSPAVKPLNQGQQTEEAEQNTAVLRSAEERDTVEEKNRRIARAVELAAQGKTPSQIFQETGLVTKANGDITDGFGGEVIWRNNGQQGISDRGTAEIKTEGKTQTEVPSDDGRGDAGGLLPQSGRAPYASLTEQQRDRTREAIILRLREANREESFILLEEYGDDAELAQEIYNDYAAGDVVLERWAEFFGDTEGLARVLDEIISPRTQQKGSPSGGAVSRRLTEGDNSAAKPTDPAEAAVEQEYRSLVENAITEGDYQRAVALYREYNNPTLRAYKEFYTLKTFSEYAASQSYIPAPDTAVGTEEALAAFEESYRKAIENAAKDGIIAAGTPTDHFDRKARLYGLEEDLAAVNPNFATKKYEWTHNCQRCVSTLEMRFRGFKVTAKPIPVKAEHDDLALTVELAWENAVKKWCLSDNGRAQVEEYMRRWGDGSRAIVGMTFPSGMGHVFFAMQIDGKTVFVDPQYPAADCEQYFKQYVKSWLYVIRVDNLQPSDRITDCCKSGDG